MEEVENPLRGNLRDRRIKRAEYCITSDASKDIKRWFEAETGMTAEEFLKQETKRQGILTACC